MAGDLGPDEGGGRISRAEFDRLCATVEAILRTVQELEHLLRAQAGRPTVSIHHATIHNPTIGQSPQDEPRRRARIADPDTEARNAWLYDQCCAGVPYKSIQAELKRKAQSEGWTAIGSIQGIIQAAHRYARRHDKRLPPPRQEP